MPAVAHLPVSLGLKPYEGTPCSNQFGPGVSGSRNAARRSGKSSSNMRREITEIEQCARRLYRIILHDLRQACRVSRHRFHNRGSRDGTPAVAGHGAERSRGRYRLEVRMADNSGMINIGMPSIVIKMLRQKFEQQWSVRRAQSTTTNRFASCGCSRAAAASGARLEGPVVLAETWATGGRRCGPVRLSARPPVCLLVNGARSTRGIW